MDSDESECESPRLAIPARYCEFQQEPRRPGRIFFDGFMSFSNSPEGLLANIFDEFMNSSKSPKGLAFSFLVIGWPLHVMTA